MFGMGTGGTSPSLPPEIVAISLASTFSFLPFRKRRVEDPRTLTTAHRMILQTVPISSQFSVSDLLSLDFALLTLRSAILIFQLSSVK